MLARQEFWTSISVVFQPNVIEHSRFGLQPPSASWQPIYVANNLSAISVGFRLPSSSAFMWCNELCSQFLKDVEWGFSRVIVGMFLERPRTL